MLKAALQRGRRGQAMVELALVAPLFLMVLFGIIILGIGIFYQQQLTHAAREGARFAIVNTGSAQCPTVSNLPPDAAVVANSYYDCDPPSTRWPLMSGHARASTFGMQRSAIGISACWSGYWTKDSLGNWADYDALPRDPATGLANPFRECTMGGINPRQSADLLPCPPPLTTATDDMASSYNTATSGNANQVTVYACYVWRPPLAGFLLIPNTLTMRAVITEALQYQQ